MKRILTVQDISCIGKCSLTVALPIISSMGVEVAALPTAVLSTHTHFKNFTYRDLTEDLLPIKEHWEKENFDFEAIYTGYLGSYEQIYILEKFFKDLKTEKNFIFIDPVMGDNGKLYTGFNQEFATRMKELCSKADIIVPNLTEVSYMLQTEYKEKYSEKEIKKLLIKLSDLGPKRVVITGVSFKENELGVMSYNKETKEFFKYFKERIDVKYHGTGDIFASTLLGALVNEMSLEESLQVATDYVWECIKVTYDEKKENAYGTDFEKVLPKLIESIK